MPVGTARAARRRLGQELGSDVGLAIPFRVPCGVAQAEVGRQVDHDADPAPQLGDHAL